MEKVSLTLLERPKRKRLNQFYELCKFFSDIWNGVPDSKKVTPHRFMRDCKANKRAYELSQIDYFEIIAIEDIKHRFKEPKAKAVLLFGRLKNRKLELNQYVANHIPSKTDNT